MLALLGMLYLCQMCLLPGLIILYFLGIRRLLQVLLMAMPVSLTANYVLFHALNAVGLRDQRTWLIVAGVEILLLLAIAAASGLVVVSYFFTAGALAWLIGL